MSTPRSPVTRSAPSISRVIPMACDSLPGPLATSRSRLAAGLEAEIVVAIDQIFPAAAQARALERFSETYPQVRVQLHESVLNGGTEMLYDGRADLVVTAIEAQGFLGEPLVNVRFVAVAHPRHPLHQLGRALDLRDLAQHRQLVVRDSALRQSTVRPRSHGSGPDEPSTMFSVSVISGIRPSVVRSSGMNAIGSATRRTPRSGCSRPASTRSRVVVPMPFYKREKKG